MSSLELAKNYFLEGLSYLESEEYSAAECKFKKSLELIPDRVSTLTNISVAQIKLKKYSLARISAEKAIQLDRSNIEAYLNLGLVEKELRNFEGAINCFNQAINISPECVEAWSNKANIFLDLKRFDEAHTLLDKAISLKPDYAEAYFNKGNVFYGSKRFDRAQIFFHKAISLKPDYAEAWSNLGVIYDEEKNYIQAVAHYAKALAINPDINWVCGDLFHAKMKMCCWAGYQEDLGLIKIGAPSDKKIYPPFVMLALVDDPLLHRKSAELYMHDRHPLNPMLGKIPRRLKNEKIRLGYFSADFRIHPVGFLVVDFLQLHDKDLFETYAFSLKNASDDMLQKRFMNNFDVFVDVQEKTDIEIASLAREFCIDIAIDLSGFTRHSRPDIFAFRAAPIQVNYLGYPGTMGSEYFDYIIADKTLIPTELQRYYSEKIAYLPHSYQPNSSRRAPLDVKLSRKNFGLPEGSFIFCCFNNNYKILPPTFNSWMRILSAVDGSILWLLEDNIFVVENLKSEAKKQGIDMDRLVFAKRSDHSEHMVRHHFADLFLDTFPYNAHTTASDALWAGLPVLTLMGVSFASRVAASLLNAVYLPELIVKTQEEYELLAIDLAKNPDRLCNIRRKLRDSRSTSPIFNSALYAKNIESLYIKMLERYDEDLKPENIQLI